MAWQQIMLLLIVTWYIGSFVWLQWTDKADRDTRAIKLARMNVVVGIVLLVVIVTMLV